jgi:hypothetical protein
LACSHITREWLIQHQRHVVERRGFATLVADLAHDGQLLLILLESPGQIPAMGQYIALHLEHAGHAEAVAGPFIKRTRLLGGGDRLVIAGQTLERQTLGAQRARQQEQLPTRPGGAGGSLRGA